MTKISGQKKLPKSASKFANKNSGDRVLSEQFLTVTLDNEQQALLPTRQLLEIVNVDLSQITAIAGIAPYVMGVYNWRGDVIWVVDLASMLGYKPLYAQEYGQRKFQDKCHVIFLRSQDTAIGFAVSRVGQMIRCDPSTIQTSALTFANPMMMQACQGYWLMDDRETFLVLNGDAIAQIVQA